MRTYIRKCRTGWKVVHVAFDGATTVIQPLSQEDAITLRDTYRQKEDSVIKDTQALRTHLIWLIRKAAASTLTGQKNPDFQAALSRVKSIAGIAKPLADMSVEELHKAIDRVGKLEQTVLKAARIRSTNGTGEHDAS